ncbi:MAG: RNA-binding S4 domain-containing protein [Rhodobacterales bacterium]|nr:RNA-binding S4 domain-containing protein [Rhodobacterales bacterium]
MAPPPQPQVRLDKWLWHARFFRTRTLATGQVEAGAVRVNGLRVVKPARMVGPGDVLTFVQAGQVRVIRVLDTGLRRGPASEARALYLDLSAPLDPAQGAPDPARLE